MEKQKTVYLAGKITGDPNFREKFTNAARELEGAGFCVMNPAVLPEGFSYGAYMRITGLMLHECETVCLLPDWFKSPGAMVENQLARACGKEVFLYEDWKVLAM